MTPLIDCDWLDRTQLMVFFGFEPLACVRCEFFFQAFKFFHILGTASTEEQLDKTTV